MEKEFYTVQEAALELGLADVTIRSAINEGRLNSVPMYGRKLIPYAELVAYRQRTQPDGEKPLGRPQGSKGRPRKTQSNAG